jgi:hypothetical protein
VNDTHKTIAANSLVCRKQIHWSWGIAVCELQWLLETMANNESAQSNSVTQSLSGVPETPPRSARNVELVLV